MNSPRLFFPFIFIASLFLGTAAAAENASPEPAPQEAFLKGNIAYADGDFAAAEKAYRTAARSVRSAAIHYNLGNSLARQQQWPEAAAHYLSALFLNPSLDAAQANLLLAAEQLGFEDSPYPSLREPASLLPRHRWILVATTAFWLALLFLFHNRLLPWKLPLPRTVAAVSLLALLTALTALFQYHQFTRWAVVMPDASPLRLAPASDSPAEITAAQGAPVRLLDTSGSFLRVRLPDGSEGFLRANELQPIVRD